MCIYLYLSLIYSLTPRTLARARAGVGLCPCASCPGSVSGCGRARVHAPMLALWWVWLRVYARADARPRPCGDGCRRGWACGFGGRVGMKIPMPIPARAAYLIKHINQSVNPCPLWFRFRPAPGHACAGFCFVFLLVNSCNKFIDKYWGYVLIWAVHNFGGLGIDLCYWIE